MQIGLAFPTTRVFEEVSKFARDRYAQRLGAVISPDPDVFAFARERGEVIGCFGLYRGTFRDPLLIERYVPDVFAQISNDRMVFRNICAELGTRTIASTTTFRSCDISLALSARLLKQAQADGVRYIAFTSNRSVKKFADKLHLRFMDMGKADPLRLDVGFRENWRAFFRVPQHCFGFELTSTLGCNSVLERLAEEGIQTL